MNVIIIFMSKHQFFNFWLPFSHDKKLYLLKGTDLCDFWQILYLFSCLYFPFSWKCTFLTDYANYWLCNELKYVWAHIHKDFYNIQFSLLQQIDEISFSIYGPKFSCTSFGIYSILVILTYLILSRLKYY